MWSTLVPLTLSQLKQELQLRIHSWQNRPIQLTTIISISPYRGMSSAQNLLKMYNQQGSLCCSRQLQRTPDLEQITGNWNLLFWRKIPKKNNNKNTMKECYTSSKQTEMSLHPTPTAAKRYTHVHISDHPKFWSSKQKLSPHCKLSILLYPKQNLVSRSCISWALLRSLCSLGL